MTEQRLLIIGNCGTGKSTLAQRLGEVLRVAPVSLDDLRWLPGHQGHKRDDAEVQVLLHELAARPGWVVEGVFGSLAEVLLPRATGLVWLDYPWPLTQPMLLKRGPKPGESEQAFADLLRWAEEYWQRASSSSHAGHLALYEQFSGRKFRLTDPQATAVFIHDFAR